MALTVGSRLGHYDVTALIVRVLRAGPNSLWGGRVVGDDTVVCARVIDGQLARGG